MVTVDRPCEFCGSRERDGHFCAECGNIPDYDGRYPPSVWGLLDYLVLVLMFFVCVGAVAVLWRIFFGGVR